MANDVYASLGKDRKRFLNWQWRVIAVTMIGYAMFYFVRKNFSVAMPGLTAEYGINNKSFGIIIAISSVVYGFSRFVNGYLVDRIKGRIVMALGLLLCALSNFLFGYGVNLSKIITGVDAAGPDMISTFILIMGVTIILNQYFQGFGYPPCARILPHWIHPSQLATKMSVWNCSHSIGAALASLVCGQILGHLGEDMSNDQGVVNTIITNLTNTGVEHSNAVAQAASYAQHIGAWQLCFYIPAALAVVTAIFIFWGLRDEPKDAGLPDLPDTGLGGLKENNKSAKARKKFEMEMVWKNRWVWTFCIANLFVYIVRMGVLDWGPKFLTEDRGLNIKSAVWVVIAFELSGVLGTLVAGWVTDRFFKGKGHRTCVLCMAGAAIFMTIFTLYDGNSIPLIVALLSCAGFCIYGPQALIGIELGNQATKEASARANGIAGIIGYIGSAISGLLVGFIADAYGWSTVFVTIVIMAIIGMFVLISMWAAPRDGYERASKINYDEE